MEANDIYQWVRNVEPAEAALLIVNATTEEERGFWIYVHDMIYRRHLKELSAVQTDS